MSTKRKQARPDNQAQELEHIKSDFITVASHMLRTPMSAIRWSLDLLLANKYGPLNPKQREVIAEAYQHNKFLVKVVNTLLRVSRIEEKGITLQPKIQPLAPIITKVLDEYRPFAAAANCQVSFTPPKKIPNVIVDALQVEAVLNSLIDNAVRYTKQGQGHVTVSLYSSGAFVTCQIKDTGIGIPANQQHLVFTKFFRAKNAMRAQTDGLGLDLYIAQQIIEGSGGAITFQSSPTGTIFQISLPTKPSQIPRVVTGSLSFSAKNNPEELLKQEREFVNITVHELKAPLGISKWSLEMLKSGKPGSLTSNQLELIEQMYRGNERLLVLVRDLLNLARLQEGKFLLELSTVNLTQIVNDVVTGFKIQARQKNIEITLKNPKKKFPPIEADPNRMAQVITNLLSNAVKYTPEKGSVSIQVRRMSAKQLEKIGQTLATAQIQFVDNPEGYLVVEIKDTGIGIAPADQLRLFTRFFRSKNVLQSKEGTGLGLYITKSIINLHRGDVWFTSKLESGSSFFFSLPIAKK